MDSQKIKALALENGFDIARICDARTDWDASRYLEEFVENNYHGTMDWFETTLERRKHPLNMWDGAVSAVMLGVNYAPDFDPLIALQNSEKGVISVYAQNNDYHDIIKKRLKVLAGLIHRELGTEVKVFVDTAPLMEKPLAARAGLGWQGKHTNLVSREFGSYLFLGSILIAKELEFDEPEINHCGTCRSCIDICPTGAIIAENKIDARLCISYLTIEHNGEISEELMAKMGNRIYGCDDCLAICPWNKFAVATQDIGFKPREIVETGDLLQYLSLNDEEFRALFSKSPIKRIGINKFHRNVLIAIGNIKKLDNLSKENYLNSILPFLKNENLMLQNTAKWAYERLSLNE